MNHPHKQKGFGELLSSTKAFSDILENLTILRQAINQKGRENVRDALLPEQLQAFDKAMGE